MKKNILIVTSEFPPQPGGIGNHAYNVAEQLCLNGYQVTVIADQRSDNSKEEREFDRRLSFDVYRITKRQFRLFMYLERFIKLMTLARKANIVIASGKFSLWSVALCSLFYAKKYIAVIHGSEVNFQNKYLKKSIDYSLKRFDQLIAVSHYTKSLVNNLDVKITVIPNGYDPKKWVAMEESSKGIKGSPKLVTVGNVTSRKGQLHVIKHLPVLKMTYPDIHYHCIGLPTEADTFIIEAKQLGVEQHVSFHGSVDDSGLQYILMNSDVFVMLSKETNTGDVEGFGIAVIEANALGLPAIGSSGSGLQDAIDNNKTGFVVDPDSPKALLSAIKEILKHYHQFSRLSRQWASKHEWPIIIKKYIETIEAS